MKWSDFQAGEISLPWHLWCGHDQCHPLAWGAGGSGGHDWNQGHACSHDDPCGAAERLKTPLTLIALVVEGHALSGLFVGDHLSAWNEAAELSAQRHIRWCDAARPFQRVLSCEPPMYDELWTGAKAMYKLEPAIAVGGEVVIYAPHLDVVSHVHGKYIYKVGYHILPYFLNDWKHFMNIPLGMLAHSTHLRGSGVMEHGIEKPNVRVTLASKISAEDCARLNLGYLDPAKINMDEWKGRENEGVLYVPKAGEILYRLKS